MQIRLLADLPERPLMAVCCRTPSPL